MSQLTLFLIRIGYLVALWIFVFAALSVVRTDLFGVRASKAQKASANVNTRSKTQGSSKRAAKPAKKSKRTPTQLVVTAGSSAGTSVPLTEVPIVIGRGADARIILDDDYVSTRHARVGYSGDQWFVEDLGSTNGTYLGSARIHQATALVMGAQIRIGKTILELRP
ncbi:phosphopeptide-binding protein [Nocardioides baekrokdamisoli]|uniref:Phosphopeptide-binding protein n=1 Tax=Nocardioides baekrokdamisoli TaxID=1804624 RepID=A0A3G9IEE1_9ACTN|nr:FHA domain-containing protein [Nocardioides baekrokdamisoli]BBH17350.1 phosphopeptide-binding protein [Nocardioides baekrokdamisoli]